MFQLNKLRNKYDESNKAKILLDKNLNILLINKEAIDLLQWKNRIIIGNNLLIHLPYLIRVAIIPKVKRILTRNNNFLSHYTFNIKNYQSKNLNITLTPLFEIDNVNLKAILFCLKNNINKQNQASVLGKPINNLSHELRAPLFNIRSFLETLYEYNNQLDSNQRLEFLEIATNETNRLNKLVNDILEFAELENKNNHENSKLSLNNVLEEILQLNQITAIKKHLLLMKKVDLDNINIINSHDSIVRILSNLLNNSIKFTYPYGVIYVKVKALQSLGIQKKCDMNFVRLSVIDNGIGIPRKDRLVVFDHFTRVSNKKNTIIGSGLGLPIVKETLAKQDQKIKLCTSPNKGTNVSFNLKC